MACSLFSFMFININKIIKILLKWKHFEYNKTKHKKIQIQYTTKKKAEVFLKSHFIFYVNVTSQNITLYVYYSILSMFLLVLSPM